MIGPPTNIDSVGLYLRVNLILLATFAGWWSEVVVPLLPTLGVRAVVRTVASLFNAD